MVWKLKWVHLIQMQKNAKSRSCYQVCSHLSADAASSRFSTPTFGEKEEKRKQESSNCHHLTLVCES